MAPPNLRSRALKTFIEELAEIAPAPRRPVKPDSRLIEDLGFDTVAFNRLGLLVYERYGVGGLSTGSLRSEPLTVEAFFNVCVLAVQGADRPADQASSQENDIKLAGAAPDWFTSHDRSRGSASDRTEGAGE